MDSRPVIFSGQGLSPRGDKDRFVLPASFRKALAPGGARGGEVFISKHSAWNCLTGFGLARREGLLAEIDREHEMAVRAGQPFDRDMRYFQLFDCAEVGFDASGRFIVPRHLRELVGIADAIYFQGSGPFFTLWSPAVLAEQTGAQWASAQAACRALAGQAGGGR